MNILKRILLTSFILFFFGLFARFVLQINFGGILIVVGSLTYILSGVVYIILALIKKTHRIEAAMMGVSMIFTIGFFFTAMRWPFGGPLIIVGSGSMVILSLPILFYSINKNLKMVLVLWFLGLGLSCFYFCFRIMFWPWAIPVYIPAGTFIVAALAFQIIKKEKISIALSVLIILNGIIMSTLFISDSTLYRLKSVNTNNPEVTFPENYHRYAWYLYKEGKVGEARENLTIAIFQARNPKNRRLEDYMGAVDSSVVRYERALKLINEKQWNEFEEVSYTRQ